MAKYRNAQGEKTYRGRFPTEIRNELSKPARATMSPRGGMKIDRSANLGEFLHPSKKSK